MSAFAKLQQEPTISLIDEDSIPTYENSSEEFDEDINTVPDVPGGPERDSKTGDCINVNGQWKFKFKINASNHTMRDNYVVLGLKENQYILINGQCILTVLEGTIALNDYVNLEASTNTTYPIIGSQSQSLPVISGVKSSTNNGGIKKLHRLSEVDEILSRNTESDSESFNAFIKLECFSTGLENIGMYYPPLKRFIYKNELKEDTGYSFLPKNFTFELSGEGSGLWIDSNWTQTIKSLQQNTDLTKDPFTTMVIGNKNSGKSTFTKALTSFSYENSIYLDLDPGQSEFSPPCCLSLSKAQSIIAGLFIGKPLYSVFYGFNTPQNNPTLYVKCVEILWNYYTTELRPQGYNLVINTPGWVKGFGKLILEQICQLIKPENIVLLGIGEETLQGLTFKDRFLLAGTYQSSIYSPAQLRNYSKLAYFHRESGYKFNFNHHLLETPPMKISYQMNEEQYNFQGINAVIVLNFEADEIGSSQDVALLFEAMMVGVLLVPHEEYGIICKKRTPQGPLFINFGGYKDIINVAKFGGLAMVHSVNVRDGYFNMYYPEMESTKQLIKQGYKLIIVRGTGELAPPEILHPQLIQQQQESLKRVRRGKQQTAARMPFVSFESSSSNNGVGKVWKVRRNVMRRGHQR